jgi:hypothetical protein
MGICLTLGYVKQGTILSAAKALIHLLPLVPRIKIRSLDKIVTFALESSGIALLFDWYSRYQKALKGPIENRPFSGVLPSPAN